MLASSYTLLSFLGTLLVMCIITNESSNFIYHIVQSIREDFSGEIKSIDGKISHFINAKEISKLIERSDLYTEYKKNKDNLDAFKKGSIKSRGANKKGKSKEKNEIQTAFNNLTNKSLEIEQAIAISGSSYAVKGATERLASLDPLLNTVKHSKEQSIAPLYALIYCFMLLVLDILVKQYPGITDATVTFLSIFTTFSVVWWIGIWLLFFKGVRRELNEPGWANTELQQKQRNVLDKGWVYLVYLLAFSIIWSLGVCIIKPLWLSRILVVGFIIIPFLLVGIRKYGKAKLFGHFQYRFAFRHLVRFFIYAMLITLTIVFFVTFFPKTNSLCFYYDGFEGINCLAYLFIIVNGLVMPFLSQYRAMEIIKVDINNKIEQDITKYVIGQIQLQEQIQDFNKEVNKVYGKYNLQ